MSGEPGTLAESLARALASVKFEWDGGGYLPAEDIAAAILATPQMRAVERVWETAVGVVEQSREGTRRGYINALEALFSAVDELRTAAA